MLCPADAFAITLTVYDDPVAIANAGQPAPMDGSDALDNSNTGLPSIIADLILVVVDPPYTAFIPSGRPSIANSDKFTFDIMGFCISAPAGVRTVIWPSIANVSAEWSHDKLPPVPLAPLR